MIRRPPRSTLFPTRRSSDLVESMSRVQIALGQNLSDWLRRMFQARSAAQRIGLLRKLRPTDIRLFVPRSEEHTSELQSQSNLVCRLLLETKKQSTRA